MEGVIKGHQFDFVGDLEQMNSHLAMAVNTGCRECCRGLATLADSEFLHRTGFETLNALLTTVFISMRRVQGIRGRKLPSLNTDRLIDDTVFDIHISTGKSVCRSDMESIFKVISLLEYSLYQVAAQKVIRLPWYELVVDRYTMESVAETEVGIGVWKSWKPIGDSIFEIVKSLRHTVMKRLANLAFAASRFFEHHRIDEKRENDSLDDEHRVEAYLGEGGGMSSREEWRLLMGDQSIDVHYSAVSALPARLRYAAMMDCGSFGDSGMQNDLQEAQGVRPRTLRSYTVKAYETLVGSAGTNCVLPVSALEWQQQIDTFRRESPFLYVGGVVVAHDSPRLQIVDGLDELGSMALKNLERWILDLSVERVGNRLRYGIEEIAEIVAQRGDYVTRTLTTLAGLLKRPRYLTEEGIQIQTDGLQYNLIQLWRGGKISNAAMAGLSPLQWKILHLAVSPNADRRYLTSLQIDEMLGTRDLGALVSSLEDGAWISDLRVMIDWALDRGEASFILSHLNFFRFIAGCIDVGFPIRSNTRAHKVGWRRIEIELGEKRGFGNRAHKQLVKKYSSRNI
jgi:hypothetical protein